jgi:hypothetical protein
VQSIGLLTISDVPALLDPSRYVESTRFKTAGTYGVQPVRLTELGRKALKMYIDIFRPYAQGDKPIEQSDKLFIKLSGEPETNIGEKVTTESEQIIIKHLSKTFINNN